MSIRSNNIDTVGMNSDGIFNLIQQKCATYSTIIKEVMIMPHSSSAAYIATYKKIAEDIINAILKGEYI